MFFIDKFTSQLYIYFGFPFGKLFVLFGGLVKQPPIFFNKTLSALLLRKHTTKMRELNHSLLSLSFLRKVRSKEFHMDRTFFSFCLPKTHCYKIWSFPYWYIFLIVSAAFIQKKEIHTCATFFKFSLGKSFDFRRRGHHPSPLSLFFRGGCRQSRRFVKRQSAVELFCMVVFVCSFLVWVISLKFR